MKTAIKVLASVLATFAFVTSASAQEEQEGTTSYGESSVTVEIPKLVIIRGVADANLGTFDGQNNLTQTDGVRVSGNYGSTPQYTVEATWSGNGSCSTTTHRISDGTNQLTVSVDWDDEAAGTLTALNCGVGNGLADQTLQDSTLNDPGADNSRWRITATAANMRTVPAGTYTGTLRLTITPE